MKLLLFVKKHTKNLLLWHLDINSVKNKSEVSELLIKDNIDIFLAYKSKLDSSFTEPQFEILG